MAFAQVISSPPSSISHNKPSINPPASTASVCSSFCPKLHYAAAAAGILQRGRPRGMPNSLRCSASSFSEKRRTGSPSSDDVVELPLFPLPLVLFPGAILPLQIFEFRYRMMMHTLLQTDLRFGVIYTDSASGTAEAVSSPPLVNIAF